MNELAGLLAFALAGMVSPGPNNAVLWASGMAFGFRRTLSHVLGTAIGMGILVLCIAAGIGALLEAFPPLEIALKLTGSAYLLYLACRAFGIGGTRRSQISQPFTVWQGIAFQLVNPKAWIFSVAVVATFMPRGSSMITTIPITAVLMVVAIGASSIWAVGGSAVGRILDDERSRRVVGVALAILLVASVVLIWV